MVSSNDVQRLFLQGVFSRGILSFKHAQVLWEKCIEAIKSAYRRFDLLLLKATMSLLQLQTQHWISVSLIKERIGIDS